MLSILVALVLLTPRSAAAQDVLPNTDSDDFRLLLGTEARLRLGGPQGRWEARSAYIYARDENASRFSAGIAIAELLYNSPQWGYLSGQAVFLTLNDGRDGSLLRLEWQKNWSALKVNPTLRLTQERLVIRNLREDRRLLHSHNTRLQFGIVPAVSARLRLVLMNEWFPFQQAGFSREYRILSGVIFSLSKAVDLNIIQIIRWRDFGAVRWQHSLYVGAVCHGVVVRHGGERGERL